MEASFILKWEQFPVGFMQAVFILFKDIPAFPFFFFLVRQALSSHNCRGGIQTGLRAGLCW